MKTKTKYNLGQSLVEVVFSIGIIVLVTGGVVSLLVNSLHSRTNGFDRKKAAELGQQVIEKLIEEKTVDIASFWDQTSPFWITNKGATQTNSDYPGYNYAIGMTQVINVGNSCRPSVFECVNTTVTVGWSGSPNSKVIFTRFFSKQ